MATASSAVPPRRGRLLKILLFLLIIDGLLLGGAELLAGWLGPPYYRQVVRKQHLAATPSGPPRIFLFGESTIDGWPYGSPTSIASWMQEILKDVAPQAGLQVVNFGKPGRGSHHLAEAVAGTLHLKPAGVIVCVGHNEFLARTLSLTLRPSHRWCYFHCNLYRLAYDKVCNWRSQQGQDFEQTSAEGFRAESETYLQAVAQYEGNLRSIAQQCRTAGVPLLLVMPAANLDWVPTAAYFPAEWSEADSQHYRRLQEGRLAAWRAGAEPLTDLNSAPRGCPAHARLKYWQGRGLRGQQDEAGAFQELARARDLDGLPLRGQQPLLAAMRRVGSEFQVPVLELAPVFAIAAQGVPDSNWFMDHCHPRPWGQHLMALALAQQVQGWFPGNRSWQWDHRPTVEAVARRFGLPEASWKRPEVESVCKQLRLNPELAVDLTSRPPLFVPTDDAEWAALRAMALWRCGRRSETESWLQQGRHVSPAAVATWPADAQRVWQELRALTAR